MSSRDGVRQVNNVTGVVLSGGRSMRFGVENKATVSVEGRPLIDLVVESLDKVFIPKPVVVVREDHQLSTIRDELERDVRFVYDDTEFRGPLAGLLGAVGETYLDWVFVCGCDMPFITPDSVTWLWDEVREDRDDVVVPIDSEEIPQTLHGFYRRKSVEKVKDVLGSEDSLMKLLDVLPNVRRVEANGEMERSTMSVNTKSDLDEVREV